MLGPGASPRRGAAIPQRPRCADQQMVRKRRSRRRVRLERRQGIVPYHHDGLLPFYVIHVGETDSNLHSRLRNRVFERQGHHGKSARRPPGKTSTTSFLSFAEFA